MGVLSKLPLGGVTSWQHQVHPDDPSQRVFARDLQQVEVLNPSRSRRLFTLFNNHLTSQFVAFGEDPVTAPAAKAARRHRQCQTIARIVDAELRPDSPFLIVRDMNDTPDSEPLQPLVQARPGTDRRPGKSPGDASRQGRHTGPLE